MGCFSHIVIPGALGRAMIEALLTRLPSGVGTQRMARLVLLSDILRDLGMTSMTLLAIP
jgi:hypothetical protein